MTHLSQDKVMAAVLIDNDPLVRLLWTQVAKKQGTEFQAYDSVAAFDQDTRWRPDQTIVYIDSDLGVALPGEILAENLFKKGFKTIYLATGQTISDLDEFKKKYPWIKKVIGKDPPNPLD